MNLSGETVLVTGASGGIGSALVAELALREVRVLAGVRDLDRFEPPAESNALEVRPVLVDLASRESIERSLQSLGEDLPRIGVLLNNAGVFEGGLLQEERLDVIYELIQVNLAATIHLSQAVLPAMLRRGRGKIVNNASIAGYVHFPASAPYAASKAGVVAFSESLRRELKGTGVGVTHLVTPGVATEMMDETEAAYEPYVKRSSGWGHNEPADWAKKVVKGIEDDDAVVGPGGAGGARQARLARAGRARRRDRRPGVRPQGRIGDTAGMSDPGLMLVAELHGLVGRQSELRELLDALADGAREEPGCASFRVLAAEEPGEWVLLAAWSDEEALRAHYRTGHYRRYRDAVGPLLARPSDVVVHRLGGTRPRARPEPAGSGHAGLMPMAFVPPARHLLRARDLADARYFEPLEVDDLARAAGLSRAHFSREFRRAFGESPHAYLLTRRLERAAALLRTTDRSVADICFSVGLQSVGSFTTSFTRTFGASPTAYRAKFPPAAQRVMVPSCVVRAYARPQRSTFREDSAAPRV